MNPKPSSIHCSKLHCLLIAAFLIPAFVIPGRSQTDARNSSPAESAVTPKVASDARPAPNPKYTTPTSPLDAAYGAKIKEYTTEKYFLTELVDHLPASDKIPSPEKVLGYAVGTPNKLTHVADLNRYYRALADATPRVSLLGVPTA